VSSKLEVHQFPCLSDNYGYLIHDSVNNLTAAIDTPEVGAIFDALEKTGWRLTHIFNTHHHGDHAGGNLEIKQRTGCAITGAANDAHRIPGIDIRVVDGESFMFGEHRIEVFETPGHTTGHIVYHVPDQKLAFVGDTLFAMGCGRLFEGSAEQMWNSLSKLMAWPDETLIYCAHEYTMANGRFAQSVDRANPILEARMAEVVTLRDKGEPTVPTNMGIEKRTNPFLRAADVDFAEGLGLAGQPAVKVFAEARRRKDSF
jgi:hydroxyacylglutathione hydrolase